MSNSLPSPQGKYRVIADQWRERIASGEWAAGQRLPGFAELNATHGLGTNTVNRIFQELEREGLVERKRGSGVFVAERRLPARTATIAVGFGAAGIEGIYYWMHLLVGVQRAALRHKLDNLLPVAMQTYPWEKIDGLLLHTVAPADMPVLMPTVHVMGLCPGESCVVPDSESGSALSVGHLLDLGHRRIGFMYWREREPELMKLRLRGYREALATASIGARTQWIRHMGYYSDSLPSQFHHGYSNMRQWLMEGFAETGCTALLVHNDEQAIGAIAALQEAGWDVPGDISVVGFDGTEESLLCSPTLTTVVVPLEDIGDAATELLARRIAGENAPHSTVTFPVALRRGESTGPAPARGTMRSSTRRLS